MSDSEEDHQSVTFSTVSTVINFPWYTEDLDAEFIPNPLEDFFTTTNKLRNYSDEKIKDRFWKLIRASHRSRIYISITRHKLRYQELVALFDIEKQIKFMREGMSIQAIRFVLCIAIGARPYWGDFIEFRRQAARDHLSGLYLILIGVEKWWNVKIKENTSVWLRVGVGNKENLKPRMKDFAVGGKKKLQEMTGGRQGNEIVPTDGNGIIGFQLHLLDSNSRGIRNMNLEEKEIISRTFISEFICTDLLGCSDSVSVEQLEEREKHLSVLKPGNTALGGRGGPYEDEDVRSKGVKQRELTEILTSEFDADLLAGAAVVVHMRGVQVTIDLNVPTGVSPPVQGYSPQDRLFKMDLNGVAGLRDGKSGTFKWSEEGFVLTIGENEWVWKEAIDDEAKMDVDGDEEGEQEIWTVGAKVGMRRTWDRIDEAIRGYNVEEEEEEESESDDPKDKTWRGRW